MFLRLITLLVAVVSLLSNNAYAAKVEQYLPKQQNYLTAVIKPEQVLGFGVGERHVRHDQLINYFTELSQTSERVELTQMGYTNEHRKQILLTISSPKNLAKLPQLLNTERAPQKDEPLVVWLGYSVHGDEISGSNAALVVGYHLAASQSQDVQQMLEDTIIVLEPSINPDGMDRFVNWVNTHRGITPNDDPNHIEHHQGWRTGRTNHFGFDLNRDWLLLSQVESKNRLAYFHKYQPHVLGDFHEMGHNSSYFFQPGIPSRTHPLTPARNTELTQLIATYHAKALDSDNRLYYSQESFDDFYYGKGSTYPDINGGVGILFEQASSRGFQQQTINGLLTFEYGVQNQVFTSLSTIEGAWKNQQALKQHRKTFYQDAIKLAGKEDFSGYLLSEAFDKTRLNSFLEKLKQHQIKVYPLTADFRLNGTVYQKEHSYYVPLAQKKYHVIQALFSQGTDFQDNTFYDVSGWTMPLAMDIDFQKVDRTWGLELSQQTWQQPTAEPHAELSESYAYVFEWHDFMAPKLLNKLLEKGIRAKVATKTFSSMVDGKVRQFKAGSVLIPAGIQSSEQWLLDLNQAVNMANSKLYAISTGLTVKGIDFGSDSFRPLTPVNVLMIGGKGTSQYEGAEILYYLDNLLEIPVSVVEKERLSRIDLNDYSHIIMIDGNYTSLSDGFVKKFGAWLKQGGVVFSQKRASHWLSEKSILKTQFVSKEHINELFDTSALTYKDKERLAARKRIAGAIFQSRLDNDHPIAYGYNGENLPLFRNSTLIMEQPKMPFLAVASYTAEPLMSGYSDKNLVNKIANNAAIVAHNVGKGRVVATSDVLTFRGYWYGSAKILANSIFFAKAFSGAAQ